MTSTFTPANPYDKYITPAYPYDKYITQANLYDRYNFFKLLRNKLLLEQDKLPNATSYRSRAADHSRFIQSQQTTHFRYSRQQIILSKNTIKSFSQKFAVHFNQHILRMLIQDKN